MALTIKRHDTRTAIKAVLKTPDGTPVDLTDATVKFAMVNSSRVIVNREALIADETNGIVYFIFESGETDEIGLMRAEFEVTYPDESIETFPDSGYLEIKIEADLV